MKNRSKLHFFFGYHNFWNFALVLFLVQYPESRFIKTNNTLRTMHNYLQFSQFTVWAAYGFPCSRKAIIIIIIPINILLSIRSKHLADHRGTINSSSDSLSVLRWYTSTTTHLIRWVNRGVFMAGDNGGDLWKYFVAYELLLHSKDAVGWSLFKHFGPVSWWCWFYSDGQLQVYNAHWVDIIMREVIIL